MCTGGAGSKPACSEDGRGPQALERPWGSAVGVFVMVWFYLPLRVNRDQAAGKTEG